MRTYFVCVWSVNCQIWIPISTIREGVRKFAPVIRTTSANAEFCEIDWRP